MVFELTLQIVQYRIRKLNFLGYRIKDGYLVNLNGTRKEFEVSFDKIQVKKGRLLFNFVALLNVEEQFVDGCCILVVQSEIEQ